MSTMSASSTCSTARCPVGEARRRQGTDTPGRTILVEETALVDREVQRAVRVAWSLTVKAAERRKVRPPSRSEFVGRLLEEGLEAWGKAWRPEPPPPKVEIVSG